MIPEIYLTSPVLSDEKQSQGKPIYRGKLKQSQGNLMVSQDKLKLSQGKLMANQDKLPVNEKENV